MRGCGERKKGGLYMICGMSPLGMPVEHFLVDPAVEWTGALLRAPMLEADSNGVYHVLMGVGARYYPFVPDFVEEIRMMGASKRLPNDFDVSKLTPGKSKMVLIHPRAIPAFKYKAGHECPKRISGHANSDHAHCIGALWPLGALKSYKRVHKTTATEEGGVKVETPSASYAVGVPESPSRNDAKALRYKPGIFISLPITRFEVPGGGVPEKTVEIIEKAGYELRITED